MRDTPLVNISSRKMTNGKCLSHFETILKINVSFVFLRRHLEIKPSPV